MGTLQAALSTIGTIASATQSHALQQASQNTAVRQLEQSQALQVAQLEADAALKKEQLALEQAQAEEGRKDALKRAVAAQRASFGAQGVGSSGGSSHAVLLGMTEESEEEKAQREALNNLKVRAVDENISQQKAINTLQRAQLIQDNKLSTAKSMIGNLF